MSLLKLIITSSLIVNLSLSCLAQLNDTTTLQKGRYITSLFGNFRSQIADVDVGGINKRIRTTGYTIGTKSGFFIKNAWALGLNFSIEKEEYSNIDVYASTEELVAGLWTRWYFIRAGQGALYTDLTAFYTAINRPLIINSSIAFHEELDGKGFGFEPGIGFAYVINKNVGFGMSVSYRFSRVYADRTDVLQNIRNDEIINTRQLQFNFNFQVYLDQFFF